MSSTDPHLQYPADESAFRRFLIDHGEAVVFLVAFVGLAYVATSYEQSARQFPLVFLAVGFVAMLLELVIIVLPSRYSTTLRRLTTGLAADMGEELVGGDSPADEPVEPSDDGSELRTLAVTIGLMLGFGLLAYLISFLLAIPFFVFGVVHFVGTRNYRQAGIVSLILVVSVYVLFGELMNVPILEGELFSLLLG